ncbi:MAG: ABC transporter permease, partial [Phycicoccus sp.]
VAALRPDDDPGGSRHPGGPLGPRPPWPAGVGGFVRCCGGLARSSVQVAVTYRGRMVLWVVSGVFPLLLMAVWLTVVAESGPPAGWTTGDFLAYYAAAALVWYTSGQHVVWEWDRDVRSGDLSAKLLRPVHPFWQYAIGDLGHRLVMVTGLVPVLVVAALLAPGLDYRLGPVEVLLTVLAAALGWVVSIVMGSTVALLGFWSTQTTNIWMLVWGVGSFASGWVAPLELMPGWLRDVAVVLPFRSTLGFPAELMAGRLDGAETAVGFGVGLAWTFAFALLYLLGWRRGVRRYQAVAG